VVLNREKVEVASYRVNLCVLLVLLCSTSCGPAPRPVPVLPEREEQSARLPDSPRVAWRNDVGSGLIAALEARGAALFATTTNRTVVALAQATGQRYWLQRFQGAITTGATLDNGRLFFATEDLRGQAYALDAARGRRIWSRTIGATRIAPLLHEGHALFATDAGRLYALAPGQGTVQWQTQFPAGLRLRPLPFESTLITATAQDSVYVVASDDGTIRQRAHLPATPSAPALLLGDTLLIPLHDATLIGLHARTLDRIFEITLDAPVLAPPVRLGETAYVLTQHAVLWSIAGGYARRLIELSGAARGSLALVGQNLVMGLLDGRVIAVDTTGRRIWEQQMPGSVVAPVVPSGAALFVPMINGEVWKLEQPARASGDAQNAHNECCIRCEQSSRCGWSPP
jgi:outer membrane protein assembly factor BamB